MPKKISVCVVGAGPAGLCAARLLAADPENFSFDVYEKGSEIGGTWVYTEETGVGSDGQLVHSSLYRNLRTNLAQEIMGFPDFLFPPSEQGASSFPSHKRVLQYLNDYAKHFDLHRHIRLRTAVRAVAPLAADGAGWEVTAWDAGASKEVRHRYDAIVVCSGTNTTPDEPYVKDIELFEGQVFHAHDYRTPDRFSGLRVAVLGAAFSGRDVAIEASKVSPAVYLCHALPEPLISPFPANVEERAAVAAATRDGFVLTDGSSIKADVLVYCTGYRYDFPFLTRECGVRVQGKRVRPLYKHIINIERPSMGLIGIPFIALSLPMSHLQMQFFLASLKDPSFLPSKEDMYADEAHQMQLRIDAGMPPRHYHYMKDLGWDYYDSLSDAVPGAFRFPRFYRDVYLQNYNRLNEDFLGFREDSYGEMYKKMAAEETRT